MRNDTELSPAAVSSFVRGELAHSLRSRSPYMVNLLLGGMDPITEKPHLYWVDYLASLAEVPYAAHGYAQYVQTLVDGREFKLTVLDSTAYLFWTNITIPKSLSMRA